MRNFQTTAIFKALLLTGSASSFFVAAPAMAQGTVDCEVTPDAEDCRPATTSGSAIVVTGSRIQRQDYEANSPTVTVDETFLRSSSTAAVEEQLNKLPQFVVSQSASVKNNDGALLAAGGDIQPNATNTPGAATVSLRGVGSNRTLALIDGRRGTPGNASGAVDVSTIPSAALQRVEVVSGGASATYGADAVAGVTNFILKRDFQGIELDAQMGISQYGDAFEYQIGGIMGTDFPDGRGNVSLAMSVNTRERVNQRDRPWYRDLWNNPTTTSGQFFFVPRPGANLGSTLPGNANLTPTPAAPCNNLPQGCVLTNYFAGSNPQVPNNAATVYFNQDGSMFTTGFGNRGGGIGFFKPWASQDAIVNWSTTDIGTLKYINALTPLTVPTTRYNFLARGNYEINDWIGVFGQGMFSNSTTYTVQEPGPMTTGWDVFMPWGTGVYTGNGYAPSSVIRNGERLTGLTTGNTPLYTDTTPGDLTDNPTNPIFQQRYGALLSCANGVVTNGVRTGGCTNTQVFSPVIPTSLVTLLNNRTNTNANWSPQGFLPNPRETFSEVITYQMVAGLEGSIPGTDWTWEAFVNHGMSTTLSRQTGMYSLERLRAVFTAPLMGRNFRFQGNSVSNGFGASTGTCTTGVNYFQGYEGISNDCREAISSDVSNKGQTTQTIAEANLQGGLFDLPAGQLRFAAGVSFRKNRYTFSNETISTAGRSFNDQVVGIYPSANMDGSIETKEAYAELLIPVLSGVPFFEEFNLEVGGRMSDYNTTGTSYTFKALADWRVTDWLRFRGGFNRAERAPNIAELLLTPQQAFRTDGIGDICSTRHSNNASANPTTNTRGAAGALDVQAICLEMMARDNQGTFVDVNQERSYYYAPEAQNRQVTGGGGSAFSYSVGNQYYRDNIDPATPALKPEVADTWTAGMVIQSPLDSGPLSRLNLTLDYFNIHINDPIGSVGAGGVLQRCLDPNYNAAAAGVAGSASQATIGLGTDAGVRARAQAALQAAACQLVMRNPTGGASNGTGTFNTASVIGTYDNSGDVRLSGIDANLSWSTDLGPGNLFFNINASKMLEFRVQEIEGGPTLDYVGTTGTGAKGLNSGSSFEYRIFGSLGYSWGPATLSLQWQHTPKTEDQQEVFFLNGINPVGSDNNGIPAYNMFNLNGSYQVTDALRLRFGVDNLLNTRPKITGIDVNLDGPDADNLPDPGALPGGGFSFFHDTQGRRFSFGANVRF